MWTFLKTALFVTLLGAVVLYIGYTVTQSYARSVAENRMLEKRDNAVEVPLLVTEEDPPVTLLEDPVMQEETVVEEDGGLVAEELDAGEEETYLSDEEDEF
jgi:hypothetical protein